MYVLSMVALTTHGSHELNHLLMNKVYYVASLVYTYFDLVGGHGSCYKACCENKP